jgi:hypothetical protein
VNFINKIFVFQKKSNSKREQKDEYISSYNNAFAVRDPKVTN